MNNLKLYVKTHLKYWYIYVATLFIMGIALFATLIIGMYYDANLGESGLVKPLSAITFGILATPLLLIPNSKAAKAVSSSGAGGRMAVNQLISIIIFSIIGYVLVELIII